MSKAKALHPDTNQNDPDAAEKFREISNAFRQLYNDDTKEEYDRATNSQEEESDMERNFHFNFDNYVKMRNNDREESNERDPWKSHFHEVNKHFTGDRYFGENPFPGYNNGPGFKDEYFYDSGYRDYSDYLNNFGESTFNKNHKRYNYRDFYEWDEFDGIYENDRADSGGYYNKFNKRYSSHGDFYSTTSQEEWNSWIENEFSKQNMKNSFSDQNQNWKKRGKNAGRKKNRDNMEYDIDYIFRKRQK